MNGAAIIATLAFCLIIVGGLPLLFLALALGGIWFAWCLFRKGKEPESNGWCQGLQQELDEKHPEQT